MKISRKDADKCNPPLTADATSAFGLPGVIVVQMFTFLDIQSHLRAACTNRILNRLSKDPHAWSRIQCRSDQLRHFAAVRPTVLDVSTSTFTSPTEIALYSDADLVSLEQMLPYVEYLHVPIDNRVLRTMLWVPPGRTALSECSFDMQGEWGSFCWGPELTLWLMCCPHLSNIGISRAAGINFSNPAMFSPLVAQCPACVQHRHCGSALLPITEIAFDRRPGDWSTIIPASRYLKSLTSLGLPSSTTSIRDQDLLSAIAGMPDLKALDLGDAVFHLSIMHLLAGLHLESFRMDIGSADPSIDDSDVRVIAGWKLRELCLSYSIPEAPPIVSGHASRYLWRSLTLLEKLSLEGCWGCLRDELKYLANPGTLTSLALIAIEGAPEYAYPSEEVSLELSAMLPTATALQYCSFLGQAETARALSALLEAIAGLPHLVRACVVVTEGSTISEDEQVRRSLPKVQSKLRPLTSGSWKNIIDVSIA
jgi:hypothetical protein